MNGYTDPVCRLLGLSEELLGGGSIAARIVTAMLFSAIIGCERSGKRHAAGLRTFMMITFASTAAMLTDIYLSHVSGASLYLISASSVIGTAIISVNSILFSARSRIKGLTTSAALWACGIIGLTVGAGFYTASLIFFAAILVSLSLFPKIETYLKNRSNHFEMHLELKNAKYLQSFIMTIRVLGMTVDDIETNPAYRSSGLSVYTVSVSVVSKDLKKYKTHTEIIEALSTVDYISHIEEMR